MTREDLTSIKLFKDVKVFKEELDEFGGKHTFTHKMSHYLKWRLYIFSFESYIRSWNEIT
jgi:hypothetical protein